MQIPQQLSRGSGIKVHALNHGFEACNTENGLLSTEVVEVRAWSSKDSSYPLSSQTGKILYFWIWNVKSASYSSQFRNTVASVTPVSIQSHQLILTFFSTSKPSSVHLPIICVRPALPFSRMQTSELCESPSRNRTHPSVSLEPILLLQKPFSGILPVSGTDPSIHSAFKHVPCSLPPHPSFLLLLLLFCSKT